MKLTNEYAREVPHYNDIPKAVLGALVMSFALHLEDDDFDKAKELIATEWAILHKNGIVPQPVSRSLYHLVDWEIFHPEVNQYP